MTALATVFDAGAAATVSEIITNGLNSELIKRHRVSINMCFLLFNEVMLRGIGHIDNIFLKNCVFFVTKIAERKRSGL